MAATYKGIKPGSRTGRQDDQGIRTYSITHLVEAGSQYDGVNTITAVSGLPLIGWLHPEDSGAYCNGLDVTNPDPWKHWEVTATYSSKWPVYEDPTAEPAIIGPWTTSKYQQPLVFDYDDKLVLNSAGDFYDPPVMKDFNRRVVTVQKNVASVPSWILDYEDAVNSAAFTLGGLLIGAGKAKCDSVEISIPLYRNDIKYYTVSMSFHLSRIGWKTRVLDAGFRELNDAEDGLQLIKVINLDGQAEYPPMPVPLDGSGHKLTLPTPATAVYKEYQSYRELPFSALPLT